MPQIAKGVDIIVRNFLQGGRLFYVGAGTSGRLGVLDASECPPTFNVAPDMVQGVIAGGIRALKEAVEGAEDSEEMALQDFEDCDICDTDTIVGISASGNPRYVIKFLQVAKLRKCKTIVVTSNPQARMKDYADCFICVETGAEAISGSTRMKAGTAQKMVLNMLSTASMVKIGKTYHNLMIDVTPTNEKLKRRAVTIVTEICGCKEATARNVLEANGYKTKHAVLYILYGLDYEEADKLLKQHHGVLRRIFEG
ncbi:MAG: N-acetylmuramic acid 6-phosphate etherase [Candidatus Gastranaerophilaceae bacterium]